MRRKWGEWLVLPSSYYSTTCHCRFLFRYCSIGGGFKDCVSYPLPEERVDRMIIIKMPLAHLGPSLTTIFQMLILSSTFDALCSTGIINLGIGEGGGVWMSSSRPVPKWNPLDFHHHAVDPFPIDTAAETSSYFFNRTFCTRQWKIKNSMHYNNMKAVCWFWQSWFAIQRIPQPMDS